MLLPISEEHAGQPSARSRQLPPRSGQLPPRSLAALVRGDVVFRRNLCQLLSTALGGGGEEGASDAPCLGAPALETGGPGRRPTQGPPGLFVPWHCLMETGVSVPNDDIHHVVGRLEQSTVGSRAVRVMEEFKALAASSGACAPAVCQDRTRLRSLEQGTCQQFSSGKAVADLRIEVDPGFTEDEGSTHVPSSDSDSSQEVSAQVSIDSDSQEVLARAPRSDGDLREVLRSDSDAQEASARAPGADGGSQAGALSARKSSQKHVSWSDLKRSTPRRVKAGGGTPLAAGLVAPTASKLPVQTALLGGLTLDNAKPTAAPRTSAGGRRPSLQRSVTQSSPRSLDSYCITLEPGSCVQVQGAPAHSSLGTVLVVNHANGECKVRMVNGYVQWCAADKIVPLF